MHLKTNLFIINIIINVRFCSAGAGACSLTPGIVYVREGEIVALSCDEPGDGDPVTLWKKDSEQKTYAQSNMSAAQQRQMGIVVHKNWLVILNTSMNHQGNYTCQSCRYSFAFITVFL